MLFRTLDQRNFLGHRKILWAWVMSGLLTCTHQALPQVYHSGNLGCNMLMPGASKDLQLTPSKATVRLGSTNEGGPARRCFAPVVSKKFHPIPGFAITV